MDGEEGVDIVDLWPGRRRDLTDSGVGWARRGISKVDEETGMARSESIRRTKSRGRTRTLFASEGRLCHLGCKYHQVSWPLDFGTAEDSQTIRTHPQGRERRG